MRLGNKAVGDVVRLPVSGGWKAFRIMHKGKPDSSYDNSFAGGTILMMDYSEEPIQSLMVDQVDERKGDCSGSYFHSWLNSTWLARLDAQVAQRVVQVRLPYRKGTQDSPYVVASGAQGLPAKVWLPSIVEVAAGPYSDMTMQEFYIEEGAKFDYFANASATDYRPWRVEDPDTELDQGWGTRTPGQYGSGEYADYFCKINSVGEWYNGSKNKVYIRPCLVLPDDTLIDDSSRVTVGVESPVKIGGAWRTGVSWVKTGGVWHKTASIHGKVDGAWKQ